MQTTEGQNTHEAELDARNENILIYVDGALLPRQEAKVSVYDSGFLLGDGVWEGPFQRRATKYLPNYLGWRLMLEKPGVYITPEHCLVAAIG